MACGGFRCSKNALIALNVLYIIVAFVLIGVSSYGLTAVVHVPGNIAVISGIIACGFFLLLISILGIIGACKHHQVMLFFYMIILFLLFVIQFGIACACLAITQEQQLSLAEMGWRKAEMKIKANAQRYFKCCGFDKYNMKYLDPKDNEMAHPSCRDVPKCCPEDVADCCTGNNSTCNCTPCNLILRDAIKEGLKISGGVGLFFSFTEFIGVWLTIRYRNQKDPRSNPREFI